MKNSEYWQRRFEAQQAAQINSGARYYAELDKQFTAAQHQIQKEIGAWYGRLAGNNGVSYQEAKRLLKDNELKEFKWDLKQYEEYAKANELDGSWIKELENASARIHINRLEAMQLQMQAQAEKLFGNMQDGLDAHLKDTYQEGFYRTAYEVQKGFGVGTSLASLSGDELQHAVNSTWTNDGRNFSDRVWTNKNKLINEMNTTLSQSIAKGDPVQKAIEALSKKLDVSRHAAGTLVMTETARVALDAQNASFKALGVEEFEVVATLDDRTSSYCQEMDGQHFPMKDYKPGITAPPFHPNCRCCTVPYFPDDDGTRIARGEDGNTYHVPAKMTYKEWAAKSVRERENSTKSTAEHNFDVTFDYGSKEFADKLSSIGESDDVTHSLINQSKAILKHRDGTKYEDLIYIAPNGKYKAQRKYNVESAVAPTAEMIQLLKDSPEYSVISIHNHPESTCPSISDLASSYDRKYKYGIAIGHNGILYKYKCNVELPSEKSDDAKDRSKITLLNLKRERLNKAVNSFSAESKHELEKVLKELYDDGIEIEVI